MVYCIDDVVDVDSLSGNFTCCIQYTMHNLNKMNILYFGMGFAQIWIGVSVFGLGLVGVGKMP